MTPRHYRVELDDIGEGRWHRTSGGRVVADSGEGYKGRTPAEALRKAARAAVKDAGFMPHKIRIVKRVQ